MATSSPVHTKSRPPAAKDDGRVEAAAPTEADTPQLPPAGVELRDRKMPQQPSGRVRPPLVSRSKFAQFSAKVSWSTFPTDFGMEPKVNSFRKLEAVLGDVGLDNPETRMEPNPKMLMTTVTLPAFNSRVWAHQFFLHVFEPLATPFVIMHLGWDRAQSQELIPQLNLLCKRGLFLTLLNFYPLMWLLNCVLYYCFSDRFDELNIGTSEVLGVPLCCLLAHKAMIALKYAMLTPSEYDRFIDAEPAQSRVWNWQLQLLSGWQPLPDDVLDNELTIASSRAGVNIDLAAFKHSSFDNDSHGQALVWDGLLNTQKVWRTRSLAEETYGARSKPVASYHDVSTTMPVRKVLAKFFRFSVSEAILVPSPLDFIIPGLVVSLPAVVRLISKWQDGAPALEILQAPVGASDSIVCYCMVTSLWFTTFFFRVTFLLLSSGNAHYYRTFLIRSWLTRLCRPVAHAYPNFPFLQIVPRPGVPVDVCSDNVKALVTCLDIISRFGTRYAQRLEAYVSTAVLITVVGLGSVVVNVSIMNDISWEDKVLYVGTLSTVSLIFTMCYLMCIAGAEANNQMELLVARLADARYQVFSFKYDRTEQTDAAFEAYAELLEFAIDKISALSVSEPVVFFGRNATAERGYTMISIVATVVSYTLTNLFSSALEFR